MSKRKELTENGTKESEQVEQTHTDNPYKGTDVLRQQQIFSGASFKENSIEKQKDSIARQNEGESGDPQATPSKAELVQHVYVRAWKDNAFHQEFLANPEAVLERDYAARCPAELSIKVVEENDQMLYFVLPLKQNSIEKQKDSIARQNEGESGDPQATPSKAELIQHVQARTREDEAFRQAFQANPKAMLKQEYAEWLPGGKFPSAFSIRVIKEEKQTICFVLPPRVPNHLPEVDDLKEEEHLEATGEIWTGCCPTMVCTGGCTDGCTGGGCSGTHCVLYGNNLLRGSHK